MSRLLRVISVTLTVVAASLTSVSGATAPADSVASKAESSKAPWVVTPAAGALLTGVSAAARAAYPHEFSTPQRSEAPDRGMGVVRFAPVVFPWVMKAAGSPTRSSWGRMAVSQGFAAVIMAGSVEALKHAAGQRRPDGSDNHSFPSGHTAIAFMGASMTARELAWRSPFYAMGAYTVAAAVAAERVLDAHHYPTDVVAGAGLGILSTELGYLIGDKIFGKRGLDAPSQQLTDNLNLSSLSLSTGLLLPLGSINCGGDEISRLPALTINLRAALAVSDHWGVGLEAGLLSMPLVVKSGVDETYVKNLSSIGMGVGPYYSLSLSRAFTLFADATAGYRFNLGINAVGDALTAGSSTPTGRLGLGLSARLTPRFRCNASAGYEVSAYKFTLRPSDFYSIRASHTVKGTSSALVFSLSATCDL